VTARTEPTADAAAGSLELTRLTACYSLRGSAKPSLAKEFWDVDMRGGLFNV
jgi:hypothetical protein